MDYNFVRQYAPELAVPPPSGWVTPEPQAGLQSPENLYGADGMPLNYIQDAGGPRQFYAPQGAFAAPTGPAPGPVRARASAAPAPLAGLRGRTDPNAPTFDIPILGQSAPQNILTPPIPEQRYNGPRAVVRIPPDTTAGLRGRTEEPTAPTQPTYNGPRATAAIPENTRVGQTISNNLGTEQMARDVARLSMDDRAMERAANPEGTTLLDMLESAQFRVPDFLRNLGGQRREPDDGLRGRGQRGNRVRIDNISPIIDIEADFRGQPRVSRTSNRIIRGMMPNFSTPEGLAEFNSRTGFNLGTQLRTRAEQDALIRRGVTNARNSLHLTGGAFDVTPRDVGGLTGENGLQAIKVRLRSGGYDPEQFTYLWETGDGPGQGTGRHWHVQPRRQ